ncbi:DUF2218 domain-containing protein [Rhodospirillum centenum]|uniref:Transcriptional regulator, PadR family protein n=1 Tax=Rhodospirillum centenum (strain ATCC 51521 / SW) TaxID=414684 RepID=B6IW77_RHOCS|nr:DUF2218 domain-containing protein [Rhodospirillum centenum]ACJ00551.1 transcriptional regulator, PadR family protein [Rhodospirillum centenum SW]
MREMMMMKAFAMGGRAGRCGLPGRRFAHGFGDGDGPRGGGHRGGGRPGGGHGEGGPGDGPWGGSWGGHRGGRHGGGRRGRLLDQGDPRLLALHLLSEKPRHGYELIRAMSDLLGGAYSPSPGMMYPTLSLLEDLGYVARDESEGGRKPYTLTPAGALFLEENRPLVETALQRARSVRDRHRGIPEVEAAMDGLKRALAGRLSRPSLTAQEIAAAAAALNAAAAAIEALPTTAPEDTAMVRATATIATANAARYLTQLCKHWSHRFDVRFDETTGDIPFGDGNSCALTATPEGLGITVTAQDAATLERLQEVVIDHLRRFAFREELGTPDWRAVD